MVCPKCGTLNDENAEFCKVCFNKLEKVDVNPVLEPIQPMNQEPVVEPVQPVEPIIQPIQNPSVNYSQPVYTNNINNAPNKKNNKTIIMIIVLIILVGTGIWYFTTRDSGNDSNKPSNNTNNKGKSGSSKSSDLELNTSKTTKTYDSLDKLPKYNNYPIYTMDQVVNKDWFSKIGVAGEVKTTNYINKIWKSREINLGDMKLGERNCLIPDAIIFQGMQKGTRKFAQTIVTKDQYVTSDGYTFFANVLRIAGWKEENIDKKLTDMFTLTTDEISKIKEGLNVIDKSTGQQAADYLSKGHYANPNKYMPWNFYIGMAEKDYRMVFNVWKVPNEMSRFMNYHFSIYGGGDVRLETNNEPSNRIILVYDELKVNIDITNIYVDGVNYKTTYYYVSPILDQEAYDIYLKSTKK